MASGILGTQASLQANSLTSIYQVPADTVSYLNFNVVNTNATPVTVRIALAASGTPTAAEYIEYRNCWIRSSGKNWYRTTRKQSSRSIVKYRQRKHFCLRRRRRRLINNTKET
jgi:hypothetical protein